MKSAYELAMERLEKQAPSKPLTDDQKQALAEVENRYQAKIAEAGILYEQERRSAQNDPAALQEIEERHRTDLRRLESERDEQKEKIRRHG